jgi:hypothetical protein
MNADTEHDRPGCPTHDQLARAGPHRGPPLINPMVAPTPNRRAAYGLFNRPSQHFREIDLGIP